ncbi:WhiB family transcriptional regulator [Streptomyces sp. NBC_01142]|uniref:WhiB family transcriptional regulator n=1 Tax=Streptomyces sp. NBC_01142 TaxID=2975865 RepID=UPI002258DDDC|nr:WhiB family transcriptional regulator [Streptomyces sp. NBC_01142]MCX4824990.1 WhiB family transcriptional regulator [Streptomyces sp. NBC_01142]
MEWLQEAACAGEPPELFFPVSETGRADEQADRAKEVCRRCPVTDQCLEWALRTGQGTGVWGGLKASERRGLRRRRSGRRRPPAR